MSLLNIERLEGLDASEFLGRYLKRLGELLDDGKYRDVKHGQIYYIQYCKKLVVYYEKMNDKTNLKLSLQKYEQFVNDLGIESLKLCLKVQKYALGAQFFDAKVE